MEQLNQSVGYDSFEFLDAVTGGIIFWALDSNSQGKGLYDLQTIVFHIECLSRSEPLG